MHRTGREKCASQHKNAMRVIGIPSLSDRPRGRDRFDRPQKSCT